MDLNKTLRKDTEKLNHKKYRKYDSVYHPKLANALARLGLKNFQIYELMGVSEVTGVEWYKNIEAFRASIQEGRNNKVDFKFAEFGGEIEIREQFSMLIQEVESLKTELQESNDRNIILQDEINTLTIRNDPNYINDPERIKREKLLEEARQRSKSMLKPIIKSKPITNSNVDTEQEHIRKVRELAYSLEREWNDPRAWHGVDSEGNPTGETL